MTESDQRPAPMGERFRVGRHNARVIYEQRGDEPDRAVDVMVGAMDTPDLGRRVVAALNAEQPLAPNTYRRRSPTVRAIQWTGRDEAEVIALVGPDTFEAVEDCPDDPDATAAVRSVKHGDTWQLMYDYEWVVEYGDGWVRMNPREFAAEFEQVIAVQP